MKLFNSELTINKARDGYFWTNFDGTWKRALDSTFIIAMQVNNIMKKRNLDNVVKRAKVSEIFSVNGRNDLLERLNNPSRTVIYSEDSSKPERIIDMEAVEKLTNSIINFFTEFEFEPNFRFINTLARQAMKSMKSAKEYIKNYFELTDSPYTDAINDKMRSIEFNEILTKLGELKTEKQINNRFKLYYGSAGTGKTTQAIKESEGNCMVCHSAMLPSDLMEDFKFTDGKATFIPSALQNAMTNGKPITLDEINLLPFESLRFLQTILDGKKQFEYKGKTIEIKDGFKIIGTMNLKVNGSIYNLPEPLVDRAEEIKNYKLTEKDLVGALI